MLRRGLLAHPALSGPLRIIAGFYLHIWDGPRKGQLILTAEQYCLYNSQVFESRTQMPSCLDIGVTSKLSLLNATVYSKTLTTCLANSDTFVRTTLCCVFSFLSKWYSPRRFRFLTYTILDWLSGPSENVGPKNISFIKLEIGCLSRMMETIGPSSTYVYVARILKMVVTNLMRFIFWSSGHGDVLISWRSQQTGLRVLSHVVPFHVVPSIPHLLHFSYAQYFSDYIFFSNHLQFMLSSNKRPHVIYSYVWPGWGRQR